VPASSPWELKGLAVMANLLKADAHETIRSSVNRC